MSQSELPPLASEVIPADVPAVLARALELHQAGDLEGALEHYRAHLAAEPDHAAALFYYATALANAGRAEEAVAIYLRCQALAPERIEIAVNLGEVYQHLGRMTEALAQYRGVLEAQPENPDAMVRLANALLLAERAADAVELYEAVAESTTSSANVLRAMARCYLMLGRWRDAANACDRLLVRDPYDAGALAMAGVARRETQGGVDRIDASVPSPSLFVVFPSPPAGYPSMVEFNTRLGAALLGYEDRAFAPADYATRGGYQTGNLAHASGDTFAPLHALINDVVERFVRSRSALARDPYLMRPVHGWRLHTWGTILGESGHQDAHIHRSAWLSGVYYVRVPPSVRAHDSTRAGWIEFGHPPSQYPVRGWYPLETIRPIEGMMLLFPSHLYHRTVPLAGHDVRISVAFDVSLR